MIHGLAMQKELEIVNSLAEKLRDPEYVRSISLDIANRNPSIPEYIPWGSLALADGYPSLVIFYIEMHRQYPEKGWDLVANSYLKKIVESIDEKGVGNFSFFSGLAGVCYAVAEASQDGQRYQNLLNQLHEILVKAMPKYFYNQLQKDIEAGVSSSASLYDLIQGVVGIGLYFLMHVDNPQLKESLITLLNLLIKRTLPIKVDGVEVPGWYMSNEQQFIDQDKENYPKGSFNLGLSHGIPGVLVLLALAWTKGIKLPGQQEAMIRIIDWIKAKSVVQNGQLIWPERVSWDMEVHQKTEILMQRMGWCYGKPGILRSLYLAGFALKDNALMQYAHEYYKEIFTLTIKEWYLPGPMFCHGLLGLYVITKHMAKDTQDFELLNQSLAIKRKILEFYDPTSPFLFQEFDPLNPNREEKSVRYILMNRVGLLDGVVGIALALLDSTVDGKSRWDRPFLITKL